MYVILRVFLVALAAPIRSLGACNTAPILGLRAAVVDAGEERVGPLGGPLAGDKARVRFGQRPARPPAAVRADWYGRCPDS